MPPTTLWYFAYGSNMQTDTFRGRRGIAPLRAVGARVAGWRLVLDKPPLFPIGESFANVVPDPAAEVFGVAYEIEAADLEHIELTEGVPIGNYRRAEVLAHLLDDGVAPVSACTLTSDRHDASLRPSERYMRLLIEGAREHALPAEYVAWLEAVSAQPENPAAAMFRPVLDGLLRSVSRNRRRD